MGGKLRTVNERLLWAMQHNNKGERRARRVANAELAKACGVRRASVQDWLNGKTKNLRLEYFFGACDYLNVRPRWLALGEEPVAPLPDDSPQPPVIGAEWTALLTELARLLARRSEDNQRRVLEIVMQMPEAMAQRPTARRAAAR
jgi:transcriptional regulator with XRE-family HTH domain